MTKMAAKPICGKHHSKINLSRTSGPISTKLVMYYKGLGSNIVSSNHDPGLTLAYLTVRFFLLFRLFNIKRENRGFIAACDLESGSYRQLIEIMKICEYSRSRVFLGLGPRSFTFEILRNPWTFGTNFNM